MNGNSQLIEKLSRITENNFNQIVYLYLFFLLMFYGYYPHN